MRNGTKPKKILWVSDGIWHPTGYGITSNHIVRSMAADGHRIYNYVPGALHGGLIELTEQITLVSSNFGDDRWGNHNLHGNLLWIDPDIIITWLDCQGLAGYGWSEHPIFMWAPIDTWPVPDQEVAILNRADRILVPSKWGQKVLADQGIESTYIPCGIDLKVYDISEEGRNRWRKQIQPPIDDEIFLIGSVGLNTGSPDRKGYGFQFDAIKEFSKRHSDFRVYIHTNPEGDGGAINLIELRHEMGLDDVIAFSRPTNGLGETPLFLRDMYNAFDVFLHCGIAEGFGLPIIEAQACGTRAVINDCSSMSELLGPDSYPCSPGPDYVVSTSCRVALPDVDNILTGLEQAYEDWKSRRQNRQITRDAVSRFDQDAIYESHWRPVLASIPARVNFMAGERKLMLAAGQETKESFVHHDREKLWPHIEVAHDLNKFPYPWENDSWDYIEASDILEHLRGEMVQVLDELWRILAPSGYLFIHTAEAGSWQLNTDPTHTQGFYLNSFDYFDPDTQYGQMYTYSQKKWKVVRRSRDSGGLVFILAPRKEPSTAKPKLEVVTA